MKKEIKFNELIAIGFLIGIMVLFFTFRVYDSHDDFEEEYNQMSERDKILLHGYPRPNSWIPSKNVECYPEGRVKEYMDKLVSVSCECEDK